MNIANLIAVIRARWFIVIITLVLGAAGGFYVGSTRPQVYSSTASLILSVHPDPVAMLYGGGTPALVNTELEVMRSDRVAQRVVRNLKLTELADLRRGWQATTKGAMSFDAWLVRLLQNGLDVSAGKVGGNVVNISYTSGEANFAATVANAFVQAYMETSIELKIDPARQYSLFFNDQVKEARDTLEKAQLRLSHFQQEKELLVTDERLDIETARLNSLSQQLLTIQAARMETSTRQAQVNTNAEQVTEVLTNPTLVSLRSELAKMEAGLTDLLARYGDNHPQVISARTQVRDIKRRLEVETRNVIGNMAVNVRIQQDREAEVLVAMSEQRQKVLQMKVVRDEGAVLARDVENAQRTYDLLFNRASQTNLESQNRLSNATILTQAVPASAPSSKTMKFLGMGLAGGIGGGMVLCILIEQIDHRVRTSSEISAVLELPVLGTMPKPTLGRRQRKLLARQPKDKGKNKGKAPAPPGGQAGPGAAAGPPEERRRWWQRLWRWRRRAPANAQAVVPPPATADTAAPPAPKKRFSLWPRKRPATDLPPQVAAPAAPAAPSPRKWGWLGARRAAAAPTMPAPPPLAAASPRKKWRLLFWRKRADFLPPDAR